MAKLTEEQLIAVMLELTLKQARLLVIRRLDLVTAIHPKTFQHAFINYEPLLERMQLLHGMLLRVLHNIIRPNFNRT